jgi:hypothetical protein
MIRGPKAGGERRLEIDPDVRRARTPPRDLYFDPAWFEQQRERVFARTWQFASQEHGLEATGGSALSSTCPAVSMSRYCSPATRTACCDVCRTCAPTAAMPSSKASGRCPSCAAAITAVASTWTARLRTCRVSRASRTSRRNATTCKTCRSPHGVVSCSARSLRQSPRTTSSPRSSAVSVCCRSPIGSSTRRGGAITNSMRIGRCTSRTTSRDSTSRSSTTA